MTLGHTNEEVEAFPGKGLGFPLELELDCEMTLELDWELV